MKNFIALLLFVSAGAAWYFYQQHGKAKAQLAEMSRNMSVLEQSVATRRTELDAYVRLLEAQKKVQARRAEIVLVQDKERPVKDAISALARERAEVINGARQSLVGQVLPELTLSDGRKLAQVRILKVDDGGLSIGLTSGVQKIASSELPEDLRARLHYAR